MRKSLFWYASILLPLASEVYIIWSIAEIYIVQLNIYIGKGTLMLIHGIFTALWLIVTSFCEKCFENWRYLLICLIPVAAVLFLNFAQYHFIISIILAVLWIGCEIFAAVVMYRAKAARRRRRSNMSRYRGSFFRFSICFTLILFAVPSVFSAFVCSHESQTYTASARLYCEITELMDTDTDKGEDIYAQNLELLEYFTAETWTDLNVRKKLAVLQAMVDFESDILGFESVEVTAQYLGPYVLGSYTPEDRSISVDIIHISCADAESCLITICHESYHAYQQYIVESIDWSDETSADESFDEASQWKENMENYISSDYSYDEYYEQPLEADANEFAEAEAALILSYIEDE